MLEISAKWLQGINSKFRWIWISQWNGPDPIIFDSLDYSKLLPIDGGGVIDML